MAPPGEELQLKRTSTIQNMFGSCESFKTEAASIRSAAATRIRDLTSRSSGGMRNLLNKGHRNHEPRSEIVTPPSSLNSVGHGPPQITSLAKAFADALTFEQLSNFLAWMLYYDSVELPESPESWYSLIDPMEMCGWVALGVYLSTRDETRCGLDLVVLDYICDRTGLNRNTIYTMLMQFADPRKMVYSQIALAVQEADSNGSTLLQALEYVQAKLHELYKLTIRIKPMDGSIFQVGHIATETRIRGYLHLVVGPRVKSIRFGTPLVTAATSEHVDKATMEGIKLNYCFEAIQQQRVVPLTRYGVFLQSTPQLLGSPHIGSIEVETEQARQHALELTTGNQALQAQMVELQRRNATLLETNASMARKITNMGHYQPAGYVHVRQSSSEKDCVTISSSGPRLSQDTLTASQAPTQKSRPHEVAPQYLRVLPQTPPRQPFPPTATHTQVPAQSSGLADKYAGIFDGLTAQSPPALRLVNPHSSDQLAALGPARNVAPSPTLTGAGRRRGSKFADELNNVSGTL